MKKEHKAKMVDILFSSCLTIDEINVTVDVFIEIRDEFAEKMANEYCKAKSDALTASNGKKILTYQEWHKGLGNE